MRPEDALSLAIEALGEVGSSTGDERYYDAADALRTLLSDTAWSEVPIESPEPLPSCAPCSGPPGSDITCPACVPELNLSDIDPQACVCRHSHRDHDASGDCLVKHTRAESPDCGCPGYQPEEQS